METGDLKCSKVDGEKVHNVKEQNFPCLHRARLRWYKAYTLVGNPSIVIDRRMKLEKEETGRDAIKDVAVGVA